MSFLSNFRPGPTPLWLTDKKVKILLSEAILQNDSAKFRDLLLKSSPEPYVKGLFAVCVITSSGMQTVVVNEAGEPAPAETAVDVSTPIHMLNLDYLQDGIKVTIGEDVFMAPYPSAEERQRQG